MSNEEILASEQMDNDTGVTECARNDRSPATRRTFLPIPYADRWLKLADALEKVK